MESQRIQVNNIIAESYVDGPNKRAVLYMQGCVFQCAGCQSRHTWLQVGGHTRTVAEVAEELAGHAKEHGNITISGGEPFLQPQALAELVYRLNELGVKHIIIYTGNRWEEIFDTRHPAYPYLKIILSGIDVLVDGRFIRELDDPTITYRGSRNQRPIDVQASILSGEVVELDWDDEIIVTDFGDILLPVGFAAEFEEIGEVNRTRRCGQSI